MDFRQKYEPRGNRIIHGAGQSSSAFNKYWNSYNFIGGHYEPDKDHQNYEYTVIREIEEELAGLIYKIDFFVKSLSPVPLKTIHFSKRHKEMTCYTFNLFQLFINPE